MTAEEYYQEGNAWRKQGDFKRALDSYMEAIALDPESPAHSIIYGIDINFSGIAYQFISNKLDILFSFNFSAFILIY